jgi:peptidoglycan/LPS O-acetylase OafA/YrhL
VTTKESPRTSRVSTKALAANPLSSIEGVRGLAILMIVAWHVIQLNSSDLFLHYYPRYFIPFAYPPSIIDLFSVSTIPKIIFLPLSTFCNLGYQGVHIFFILSGFGLTLSWHSALRENGDTFRYSSLKPWMIRRFRRVIPLLWFSLLLLLVLFSVFGPEEFFRLVYFSSEPSQWVKLAALTAVGLNAFSPSTIYGINPPLWFITPLFQFYLVFPVLYSALFRLGPLKFLVLVFLGSIAFRYFGFAHIEQLGWPFVLGAFFGSRLAEFGFGMVLAASYLHGKTWKPSPLKIVAAFAGYLLGLLSCEIAGGILISDGLIGISLFFLTYFLIYPFETKTLSLLGKHSLGIFLIHFPMMYPLQRFFFKVLPNDHLSGQIISFVLVVFSLCALGIIFERTFNSGVQSMKELLKRKTPT